MSQAEFDSIISEHVNQKLMAELAESEKREMWIALKMGPAMSRDALLNAIHTHIGKTTWVHDDPKAKPHIIFPNQRPKEEIQQETADLMFGRAKPRETRAPDPKRYEIPCKLDDKQKPIIPDQDDLFSYFKNNFKFAVIRDNAAKGQDLLVEWNRLYKLDGQVLIRQILTANFPAMKQGEITELIGAIRNDSPVFRDEFDQNPMILNCKNTLVDLESGRAIDDPTYESLAQMDVAFRPDLGESEIWLPALKEACPDDWQIVLDFAAASLSKFKTRKALILLGEGHNGKSTILEAIKTMYGPENTATSSLVRLNSKYGLSALVGKHINISTELPGNKEVKVWDVFKALVAHESQTCEPKFKREFTAVFDQALFFACNELPERPQAALAVEERLEIIEFNQVFRPNPTLEKAMLEPDELSRILNTLIQVHREIVAAGGLRHIQPLKETRRLWQPDLVEAFLEDHVKPTEAATGPSLRELHKAYRAYCTLHNRQPLEFRRFNKALKELEYTITHRDGVVCWQHMELTKQATLETGS